MHQRTLHGRANENGRPQLRLDNNKVRTEAAGPSEHHADGETTLQIGGGDASIRDAISASGALNRPRRNSGGSTASTASSFSVASIRR